MKSKSLFLICIWLFLSCKPETSNKEIIKNEFLESILGNWKREGEDLFERWEKKEGKYQAVVNKIGETGEDILKETVIILEENGDTFYRVIVPDQNDAQPIKFKLIAVEKNKLVFEDPTHDFPQRITYELVSEMKLVATISGLSNGEEKAIPFNYVRQK